MYGILIIYSAGRMTLIFIKLLYTKYDHITNDIILNNI